VYGIGPTTARAIMAETELPNERVKDLSEDQLTVVRAEVDKYMTEGDLRRFNALNIKRLVEIGSFRGRRHIASLPVRGQKSKTNARTRKGRSKGAIAGKKIAKKVRPRVAPIRRPRPRPPDPPTGLRAMGSIPCPPPPHAAARSKQGLAQCPA